MKYYSAIKRNGFELVVVSWMNLEPLIHSEVSQKEKNKCVNNKMVRGVVSFSEEGGGWDQKGHGGLLGCRHREQSSPIFHSSCEGKLGIALE